MKDLSFNCTFLTDVVLNAQTATEGSPECLDFVPGSNFLGIVAKRYDEFEQSGSAYRIFHSGDVQFGDAHPVQDGMRALRMPASWFTKKGVDPTESLWVHHHISSDIRQQLRSNGTQLKQVRSGFFLQDSGQILEPNSFFAVKAAYDRSKRRNADGKLYGYNALRRGSSWEFTVRIPDDADPNELKEALVGRHNLGRSRSAQYGRVQIDYITERTSAARFAEKGKAVLYAESRWALLDQYGQPTACPSVDNLGLPEGSTILLGHSQIRTVTYAPWNAKRCNRDADRVCVEKGSVVVVNLSQDHHFDSGLGLFNPEGLGQVLVNPGFLEAREDGTACIALKRQSADRAANAPITSHVSRDESDAVVLDWLEDRKKAKEAEKAILSRVNEFMRSESDTFKDISTSQWGQVRAIASRTCDVEQLIEALFTENTGMLCHGVSAEKWRKRRAVDILRDELEDQSQLGVLYAVRLAAAMQKAKQTKGGE